MSVLCFAVEVWNRVKAPRAMEESVVVKSVGVLRLPNHCVSPARRLFTRWRLLERGACACRLGICNGTGTIRVATSLPWMRIRLTGASSDAPLFGAGLDSENLATCRAPD